MLLILVCFAVTACGSSARSSTATTAERPPQHSVPPVPSRGEDYGIINEMSGWPTMAAPPSPVQPCIVAAAEASAPTGLSIIRASNVDSGRRTSDGFSIPAATVISYTVKADRTIEVTTDTREQPGGTVLTRTGSTISSPGPGQIAVAGCTSLTLVHGLRRALT